MRGLQHNTPVRDTGAACSGCVQAAFADAMSAASAEYESAMVADIGQAEASKHQ
jgi:hypothetical protein